MIVDWCGDTAAWRVVNSTGGVGGMCLWIGGHVVRAIGPVGEVGITAISRVNHVRVIIDFRILIGGRSGFK